MTFKNLFATSGGCLGTRIRVAVCCAAAPLAMLVVGCGQGAVENAIVEPQAGSRTAESPAGTPSDIVEPSVPSDTTETQPEPNGTALPTGTEIEKPNFADGADKPGDNSLALFDGKSLEGWTITKFGGEGDVQVKESQLILKTGVDLTGVTWKNADVLPKSNYEVTLEAMRVDGSDFFCGLTFPVKDAPCSLILGGWGGGVCGLSSLDGFDASENETTSYREFENGRWYKIKLRVQDDRIDATIDGEPVVEVDITGRKISIRPEVELSRPFGIASWQTTAALRNITLQRLTKTVSADAPKTDASAPDAR